ncbi:MAG TPA: hypothetical protein VNS49_14155 [Streptomyces sp.]|nr:hypothetical protein [Streptomyces sp.]
MSRSVQHPRRVRAFPSPGCPPPPVRAAGVGGDKDLARVRAAG